MNTKKTHDVPKKVLYKAPSTNFEKSFSGSTVVLSTVMHHHYHL